jgi:hypothetical protein
MADHPAFASSSIRLKDLLGDVLKENTGKGTSDWPDPAYARVASAIADDGRSMEKLERLCEDLESTICLRPGPGAFVHLVRTPRKVWEPLEGRCWREILVGSWIDPLVWEGLKNFARALKSPQMDTSTRRTGLILHAVAVRRLEAAGFVETDPEKRKRHLEERRVLLTKPYLPDFILNILKEH